MKTKIDQKNKNSIKQTSNRVLHKKAFTLIELLVVVAIISLLSSLVLSSLTSARMKANDTKIAQDLRQFRISAELYYNEYHVYPPLTMNYGDKNFAVQDTQNKQIDNIDNNDNNNWANKLSFFIKTADAATFHTTPLCLNFDKAADYMISKKYLSKRPVHPYDNDAAHICYKAISTPTTFSAYGSLAAVQVSTTAGVINKRTGFIIGDTTSSGISSLAAATVSADAAETPYPIAANGATSLDLAKSLDAIPGITSGSQGSAGNGGVINSIVAYHLTVTNSNSGAVTYSPVKDSYSPGETVTITGYPFPDYSITYMDDPACPYPFIGNSCIITMDKDKTVLVSFNPIPRLYVNAGTIRSGYSLILTYNSIGGAPFYSGTAFSSGDSVSVYAAVYNGISYLQPNFTGCDSVSALTNCNVSMNGNKTITVSAP